jgi:hypothetical protein
MKMFSDFSISMSFSFLAMCLRSLLAFKAWGAEI